MLCSSRQRLFDNIYSFYGKWQLDKQTKTSWRAKIKREQRRGGGVYTKETCGMGRKTSEILNELEEFGGRKTAVLRRTFSPHMALIGWTSARLILRRQNGKIRLSVHLQMSKLDDVNYTYPFILRDAANFNRAWQWDIFRGNKVVTGFPDRQTQTGALSRQWAVDNP